MCFMGFKTLSYASCFKSDKTMLLVFETLLKTSNVIENHSLKLENKIMIMILIILIRIIINK